MLISVEEFERLPYTDKMKLLLSGEKISYRRQGPVKEFLVAVGMVWALLRWEDMVPGYQMVIIAPEDTMRVQDLEPHFSQLMVSSTGVECLALR